MHQQKLEGAEVTHKRFLICAFNKRKNKYLQRKNNMRTQETAILTGQQHNWLHKQHSSDWKKKKK